MATYNGKEYLREQMDSIRTQTKLCDEIIICDDFSSDGTGNYIAEYIKEYNLETWHLLIQDKNVGWKRNFRYACQKAKGDIILLCDQDDIWIPEKVEKMMEVMSCQPEIELLTSDYYIMKNDLIMGGKKHSGKIKKIKLSEKFFHCRKPGCSYAIRRRLFEKLNLIWNDELPHDVHFWLASIMKSTAYNYELPLFYYRRHDQTVTGREEKSKHQKLRNIENESKIVDLAEQIGDIYAVNSSYIMKVIKNAKKYIVLRKRFLESGNFCYMIKLITLHKYFYSKKTLLGDFFVVLANK